MIEIRGIHPTEWAADCASLERICFPVDECVGLGHYWWMALDGGTPCGFLTAVPYWEDGKRYSFVSRVGVLPEYRGRQIAQRLIMLHDVQSMNRNAALLTYTMLDNVASANAFLACGWRLYLPEVEYVGKALYLRKDQL